VVAALRVIVALLDTAVLFPFYLRDTLLRAAEMGLYQARWSQDILTELQRVLVERGRMGDAQARRLLRALRAAFPEAEESGYRTLINSMTNEPGDRHVLAAAVHAKADVIVSSNLRHFPKRSVAPYAIRVQSPDAFLLERLAQAPEQMSRILQDQASEFQAPRMTASDILDRLFTAAPMYAAAVRALL
jgi:predicted nucleic acid-binding protein